ncbi:sodium-dependent glucose transporter 1C-like [Liolophura sinensis]|uniref:sodium-dependent glucose transporter 1C-like n=1 Tax=Liolophura sinensis TaxID=3198878 RepID=UPI0031596009
MDSGKVTVPQVTEESGPDGEDENAEGTRRAARFKLAKTSSLFVTWVCMGLYGGITGPTVPDLGERLHTDYDSVGFAIAFRSMGKLIGSPAYGYLRDRFSSYADLLLGVALTVVSISVITKPWVSTVSVLASLFFVEGVFHSGINAVGNSMCVLMWKEKAAMPVHLLHFGYGLGALVSPLIATPFLSHRHGFNQTSSTNNETFTEEDIIFKESLIEIPYAIVSGFVLLTGMANVGFFLYKPFRRMTSLYGCTSYSNLREAPFLKDRPKSAVSILALFFLFNMMTVVMDRALGSFLFTYAMESGIGFSKGEAAYLNTGFFACYAGGRAIMGLLAHKIPVRYVLFSEVYLTAACSAIITFYGYDKRLILWVFSCSLAFFFGPVYPSGMAWVDRYVPLYGVVVAIFDIGSGIGAFISNWMSGYLISNLGPRSLLYFTFSAAGVLCLTMLIAQFIGNSRGDRHQAIKKEITVESEGK